VSSQFSQDCVDWWFQHSPSFISKWIDDKESVLNRTKGIIMMTVCMLCQPDNIFAVCLHEIKTSIYSHNATLYRACANANPHNMNEAMIGISKEVIVVVFPW
jgi:hypothetical protein